MSMPTVEQLSQLDFWESPESHVMVNLRSKRAKGLAVRVEAWLGQHAGLQGCVWVATSGTSGRTRFVCLSKSGLLKSAAAVNQHLQVASADRWLCALPEFHVGGLGIYARAVQSFSEVIAFDGAWDAKSFCEALEKHRITLVSLVPTQIHDLVSLGYQCPEQVRVVVVGGERMENKLGQAARKLGWPVLQSYGLTEAGSQVATESLLALEHDFCGKWLDLLSAWQVRTNPGDDQLQIKGEALCRAYLELSSEGELEYTAIGEADGWFTTGDRVEIRTSEELLELCVLGRADDVIKVLGEQVSMTQLNQRLRQVITETGALRDGFLLALPDERKGRRIVAALVLSDAGVSAQRQIDVFNEQVESYERISKVRVISEIPRSALGKVKRQDLVNLYENARDERE